MKSLSDLLEKKRNLEAEREELVRRLEEVDTEIINTQVEYGAIYNSDSPILSLPADVTCLIFLEALSTLEFSKEDDYIQVHPTELTISHVCRQWRSDAIELPFLWSSFYYHGPSATPATLNRFKVYLDRSKPLTLELWLDLRQTTPDHQLWAMLDQAIAVVSRWRVVSIFSDSTEIASRLKSKALHTPNLEHLTLHLNLTYTEDHMITSLEPQFITEGAPKLTSAWLDVSTAVFCLPPISTLTTLRIEIQEENEAPTLAISSAALLLILTLPNLENLSVVDVTSFHELNVPDVIGNTPIFMNRLRHLRISDSVTLYRLLPTIRAPLLETLVLRNMWIELDVDPFTDTKEPNVYSFPSLTSISLLDISCNSGDSLLYFALMTSAVRTITIVHQSDAISGVLHTTQGLPSQMALWPHLETLICDLGRFDLGNLEILFEFLKHPKNTGDLRLRISDVGMAAVEEFVLPDSRFAEVLATCLIEGVPEMELRNVVPWPPGENGVLGKRIDLEADSFSTRRSRFLFW